MHFICFSSGFACGLQFLHHLTSLGSTVFLILQLHYTINNKNKQTTEVDELSEVTAFGKDVISLSSNIFLLFLIFRIRAKVARKFVKMAARVTQPTKTRPISVCALVVFVKDLTAKVNIKQLV